MAQRVCIFVDGENFRHSIVKLFDDFDKKDYLPHTAKWDEFFDWIVTQTSTTAERIRTYWYVVKELDFFPYKFPNADGQRQELRTLLCKDDKCRARLNTLVDQP